MIADDSFMEVKGKGNFHILKNVQFCPEAKHTLISISTLCEEGFSVSITKDKAMVYFNNIPILNAVKKNKLYYINLDELIPKRAMMATSSANLTNDVLHARLGHPSHKLMQKIKDDRLATGIKITTDHLSDCKSCLLSKAHRRGNRKELRDGLPKVLKKSPSFGALLHIDSSGPFNVPAIPNNETHILVIIDTFSGYIFDFYNSTIDSKFVIDCLRETFAFIQSNNGNLTHYHSDGALS